jgi:type I restriction-modification system DNA methylase subunit
VHPLEIYFSRLRNIRAAGIGQPETSYYDPLATLLTTYGRHLSPRVTCIMQIQNQGAGMPDGGLFTAEQLRRGRNAVNQVPSRGVIEAKRFNEDIEHLADTQQVRNYLGRYGVVLATNFREFLLLQRDPNGNPRRVDAVYRFLDTEDAFVAAIDHPRVLAEQHAPTFDEFITRALQHNAPLASPADLAHFLASYAREAKARVELAGDVPAIRNLRFAFSQALGMTFEDENGERFFQSSLIQTLFYGVFSAWVLWRSQHPLANEYFRWQDAIWNLRVPMINVLFAQIAQPLALEPLGLLEVLDWTADTLNRVQYDEFFQQLQHGDAVQYFYEPFLQEFDPDLRKKLGVWYTPREVVRYMVERIDQVLRSELGIRGGFADERVIVLDPCCGTGAYLVEVLNLVDRSLRATGAGALRAHRLKQAAARAFGFEILAAPFVVAHLQLGLLLHELGAPFAENERAAVFLTNSLTGWTPPAGPQQQLMYAEMQQERDRADHVKQQETVLVILGNPPYNGFAGIAVGEERELSDAYRTTVNVASPEGHGLNELYIRFFRAAERKIVERSREGVVCYISNYSWLDSRSCPGMRERYLDAFDSIWIDSLNGDAFSTGKVEDISRCRSDPPSTTLDSMI